MGKARDETKVAIISGAEKAFLQKGLFDAAMEDIALFSGVTRRTLYRHFEKKEDLAFEVACGLLERWNLRQERIFGTLEGTGLSRLREFLVKSARYLAAHDGIMKFMGEFDFYFKDDASFVPDRETLARYDALSHASDAWLRGLLALGVEDRSIRAGIDVGLTVFTISNILWGYGQRIAARKKQLKREFGMEPMKLIFLQIELYALALENRSSKGPEGRRASRGGRKDGA
jgi:AcrR family transcriptional regulator